MGAECGGAEAGSKAESSAFNRPVRNQKSLRLVYMNRENSDKPIELFYDGACPLCSREMEFLKRRDTKGRLCFTNIASPGFVLPGVDRADLMARIHARLPDGSFVTGVEVFRIVYAALGYRRCVAFSRLPVVRGMLDVMYRLFARHRPRLGLASPH